MYLLILALACSGGLTGVEDPDAGEPEHSPVDSDSDGGDTADSDDTSAPDDSDVPESQPPEPPPYSGGTCPVITDGWNRGFSSDGESREFFAIMPSDPEGAPVIFAYHWIWSNVTTFRSLTDVESLSERLGAIVIMPESCCGVYSWPFLPTDDAEPDLVFFDDALRCLLDQNDIDLRRVYATGMSAGGLWTTYLAFQRSESLAAAAPLSGGTGNAVIYQAPSRQLPMTFFWGGNGDSTSFGGFGTDFDEASLEASASLRADGHLVMECEHSRGHTIHSDSWDAMERFFADHPWSKDGASSYAAGMPADFPVDWCRVP